MLDVVDRLSEQNTDMRVVEGVNDLATLPFADHEAEMTQQTQLMGDSRLLHSNRYSELAHRTCGLSKTTENTNAARSRERLHRLCDLFGRRRIELSDMRPSLNSMAHTTKIT